MSAKLYISDAQRSKNLSKKNIFFFSNTQKLISTSKPKKNVYFLCQIN